MFLKPTAQDKSEARPLLQAGWPHLDEHSVEQLLATARTDSHILITGSRRVDKAGCAKLAHEQSRRGSAPLVSVNCAEIARRGWEDALFGQLETAAGAVGQAMGDPLATADGGTLFLDEVHALSRHSQLKLLRFLEEKQYRRLTETVVRRADVRVIGATDADLYAAVGDGRFRADLFARFHLVSITPPLLRRSVAAIQTALERVLTSVFHA